MYFVLGARYFASRIPTFVNTCRIDSAALARGIDETEF